METLQLYYKIVPKHGLLAPKLLLGEPVANRSPTQTWRLTLESLCEREDLGVKTSQLDLYDGHIGSALRNHLLHFFDQLSLVLNCQPEASAELLAH